MHRCRIVLTAALLGVALMWVVPASAGGPTSALLTVPGEGRTASLYYTDPEYDALAGLVGIESDSGVGAVDESGQGHESGPGITVTWMIHDVLPWRIDHIYLEGEGAPWIATQVVHGGNSADGPAVWHQPEAGAQLAALLDELGLADASRAAGEFSGVAGSPVPPQTEPLKAPAVTQPSATAGIWWGLGGMILGALVVAGLWVRTRFNKAAPPEATTQDRRDVTSGTALEVTEELAWPPPRA